MKLLNGFNILMLLLFSSCTNFKDIGKEFNQEKDFVPPPDMEFYGFRRESYDTNFKQLDSFAVNAKFYNQKKIIELYDSRSYTYESNRTIAASISGEFVIINQETLYTQIYTNVIAKSSNNTILYTEYLQWDNEKQQFRSPVPIRIEHEDGSWLTGSSMEGDIGLEHITIYNEVDEGNAIGVPVAEDK
ncbi:LPS export ABC transporter periplasmic protein LptC [uncultured Brachyspira sp.]|uniref:LPS export ABC transporter periplasmic protein LptC n=1 Tax=uncultured Brachyspira sp. TaxID=221953 RepID=UPI0025F10D8E|nr:LPS export ABC transporter periplasmic protein LptC [uncultured Brachyspira sp.]